MEASNWRATEKEDGGHRGDPVAERGSGLGGRCDTVMGAPLTVYRWQQRQPKLGFTVFFRLTKFGHQQGQLLNQT
jgi:hypothetical protein